jgi:predicted RNA-binding protein with PIN domain
MALHIIVDGYNLIRQSKRLSRLDLEDLQRGRDALIESLSAYKRIKKHRITVVFDGINAPLFVDKINRIRGIDIRFSRPGETADSVIKRMAFRFKEKVLVVSSDRDVSDYALSQGAAAIESQEFEQKMELAVNMELMGSDGLSDESEGWIPTTKKKGPRRRASKRDRQIRKKTTKL